MQSGRHLLEVSSSVRDPYASPARLLMTVWHAHMFVAAIASALLTPGVTQDPRGLTSSSNGDLAFGGLRGYHTSFLVDGSDNNNAFFAQARGRYRAPYQFSNEVVQEFVVSTNSYGAELGGAIPPRCIHRCLSRREIWFRWRQRCEILPPQEQKILRGFRSKWVNSL